MMKVGIALRCWWRDDHFPFGFENDLILISHSFYCPHRESFDVLLIVFNESSTHEAGKQRPSLIAHLRTIHTRFSSPSSTFYHKYSRVISRPGNRGPCCWHRTTRNTLRYSENMKKYVEVKGSGDDGIMAHMHNRVKGAAATDFCQV